MRGRHPADGHKPNGIERFKGEPITRCLRFEELHKCCHARFAGNQQGFGPNRQLPGNGHFPTPASNFPDQWKIKVPQIQSGGNRRTPNPPRWGRKVAAQGAAQRNRWQVIFKVDDETTLVLDPFELSVVIDDLFAGGATLWAAMDDATIPLDYSGI